MRMALSSPFGPTTVLGAECGVFALFPDNELMESVCENERDFEHLVGK